MKTLLAVTALSMLTACKPSAVDVAPESFDPSKIAYFRDPGTRLCFSVVSIGRIDTGGRYSYSISHSHVPCTSEVLTQLRNPS